MNTTELTERVATDTAVNAEDARKVIDGVLRAITAAALRGEEVALSGFGRFKVADRAERQGRNPGTGEPITIAAQKKLTFMPAKNIRDALNPTAGQVGAAAA